MAVASVISGTGSWTLISASLVSPVTLSVSDPPTKNPILASGTPVPDPDFLLFPTVQMVFTLTADGTDTVNIIGDASTQDPNPVDSIGFTANVDISVVNDTGHDLSGLTLNLTNVEPSLPYNQGNSTVYYGEADYDANYAYFTHIQPVDGETMALFTPTGVATTPTGAAASQIVLTGTIAQGATVVSDSVVHNTELTSFNDFNLSVTDTAAVMVPPPTVPTSYATWNPAANILLQNTSGPVMLWQMSGATISGGGQMATDPGNTWHAKGMADFYGDGNPDILWQNDNGAVALWDTSGTNIIGGGAVASNPGPAWHVEGTGAFYGVGSTAIVFQNNDGSVALWDMNGTTIVGGGIAANPGPTWHIEGTADFIGDGNTDILWQNNDGSVALWDMSGTSVIGGGLVTAANPGPTWHVRGTGDFYGDGHTDILWQNDNGAVALWDMDGLNVIGGGLVNAANPGPTWHIEGTGDFNGDGHADIQWQNDDGTVAIWEMNGTDLIGGGVVSPAGTNWNVVNDNMQFIYSTAANETLAATPTSPDEFVFTSFAAGAHTITGFNPVQDIIEVSKLHFESFADVQAAMTATAAGTAINLGGGSSLLLAGINPTSLHASNFAPA